MIASLTISAALIAFAINVLTSLMKKYIYPRFGKIGIQVVAFVLALIGAWYFIYGQHIESFAAWVTAAFALFSIAVTFYEVILQHIPVFKGTSPEVAAARRQNQY